MFAITAESGVAAGVRRIEAITGLDSVKVFQEQRDQLVQIAYTLNARQGDYLDAVVKLQDENKRLAKELQQAKMKAALGGSTGGGASEHVVDVRGVKLVAQQVAGLDKDGLRTLADSHRSKIKSGVVVLASAEDSKVSIVVAVTPDVMKQVPAGQVVKQLAPIVGGGGGGRPDFAEAGGKDPSKIKDMLDAAKGVVEKLMGG